jgi:hypothetical protein
MREGRTSGFVRGAHSNMCPYRDLYLRPSSVRPASVQYNPQHWIGNLTLPTSLLVQFMKHRRRYADDR